MLRAFATLIAVALSSVAWAPNLQATDNVTVIATFSGPAFGENPSGGLIQGTDGYFYGTTQKGGPANAGTIFKIAPGGAETVLYNFTGGADGANPMASLTQGTDGNFYGTAYAGGNGNGYGMISTGYGPAFNGYGTVFKITPAGVFTLLYTFTGRTFDGQNPMAGLVQGKDGSLYGTTSGGNDPFNAATSGTVFKITTEGVLTPLHTFAGILIDGGSEGAFPRAGLTLGKDGNFYGTTESGGYYGIGTVFQITPAGVFTILYSLGANVADGSPEGGLTQGADGNFYGSTYNGGLPRGGGYGTIFKITPAGAFTTIYTFQDAADGAHPQGNLTLGADKNFYGTTSSGTGTIFQITPDGVLTTKYHFASGEGSALGGDLALGKDGYFYGTTSSGGNGNGTVFKITPAGALTPLYAFPYGANDGSSLQGGVIEGKDGNFYGTTESGGASGSGASGHGTVFQVTPAGVITTLYNFTGGADGANPGAGLALGTDGNFYGTTHGTGQTGDVAAYGTVFEITSAGALKTLHTFSGGADGAYPLAGLTLGTDGNFYGTASGGGDANNGGTVFKITPAGIFTHLYTFSKNSADGLFDSGSAPEAGLTLGKDGNFYGTTSSGGSGGDYGTVFKITPAGVLTSLHSFTPAADGVTFPDGEYPAGALTLGTDGNLYGTTYGDSAGDNPPSNGTVFKITPAGVLTTLHTFGGVNTGDGANPAAGLILRKDGNFYGTTSRGGTGYGTVYGTVFKITPAGVLTILQTFDDSSTIQYPQSGLTIGADGNFYGTDQNDVYRFTLVKPAVTSATLIGQLNQVFSYQVAATNGPSTFAATHLPSGLRINPPTGLIEGIPLVTGTFAAEISVTNPIGTGTGMLGLTIYPPPPVITSVLTGAGQVAHSFSYQITAANTPTSFTASGLPAGLSINTTSGLISGKPDASGTFTVGLSAANSGGTGTATLVLTIKPAIPEISSVLTASGQAGQAFSYQITARYAPTSFGATSLPAGLSVNTATGLISGTPTASGTFSAGLSATNAAGTGTATLTLTINPPPPAITSALSAAGQVAHSFSYQITAANSPTSFAASGLPAGLSINTTSGLISGKPDASGTYTVGLSATNSGGTGTAKLVVTVKPAIPEISSVLTANGQVGQAFSYQITARYAPTSFAATGLPAGLSVNAATGLISGAPAASGKFSVGLSATNAAGTGTATLTLTINPATPVITSVLTSSGQAGRAPS